MTEDRYVFTHTEVEDGHEGEGLGSLLVKEALDDVRARGGQIVPVCPFVTAYIERHQEYADLVDKELTARTAWCPPVQSEATGQTTRADAEGTMKTDFDSYEPGRPCWVDVMTTDVDASKQFYGQLFGWDAEDQFDDQGNRVYVMFSKAGRSTAGMAEMAPQQRASGMPPVWSTYIATDDADKTASRVSELGGTVIMPPMDVMSAGRMLVTQDPTGAFISFWQAGEHKGAALANAPGSFGWNELQTRDTAAAEQFYTDLIGWTASTSEGDMPYTEFQLDGESVAAMMPMPPMVPAEVPGLWLTYFVVEDCDASVATIEFAGGSVMAPPMDVPVGRFAAVSDPLGAVFAVIALSGEALE